jgi:CHAT domain-containing protein/tetratricopeptide (TPR) repeat protein
MLSHDLIPPACRRLQALAERDPRRAVPLAHRALQTLQGHDPLAHAWAHYTLGWALLCWERFDAARPYLRAAQEAFEAQGTLLAALRCRHAQLQADLLQFARPDLEQEFATLAGQFVQAGAPLEAACVSLNQARLLYVLSRPDAAEAILARISPLIAQAALVDQARLLRLQGAVANLRNAYARATELLTQAEHAFTALRYPCEVAKCWLERAWVALRQEQLDQALVDYQRAERVFNRFDLPLQRAFCAKNIGLLMARRGAYDLALQSTLTALQLFRGLQRTKDIGGCLLNLGNIYLYIAHWEAALACYDRAEAFYTQSGVVGERLLAQRNRAMVYRAQGWRAEALTLLAAVEHQAQQIGNHAELAEVWHEQAALLAEDGQIDAAIQRYRQARDRFARLGNLPAVADCALEQGWLALRRGAVDEAEALFRSAAPALARHPHKQWRITYGLARCAEVRSDSAGALERYRAASATVAGLRRRLASEKVSSNLYTQAAQLHTDALRLAASSGAVTTLLEISERQRALVLQRMLATHPAPLPAEYHAGHEALRMEISSLLARSPAAHDASADTLDTALAAYGDLLLRARHSAPPRPDPHNATMEAPFDLEQIRALLAARYGDDWTALAYTLNDDVFLIGVVTSDGLALEQVPCDAPLQRLIDQAVQPRYRNYTYRDLPYLQGQATRPWAGLHALAERLLPAAARARLHPGHRLLIVPAGPLHALPWAALRLDAGWLAERAVVQIVPSLTTWQVLAARRPAHDMAALLVGCSDFGARAPALPSVAAELAAVAARWPGACHYLRDTDATRAALLDRSARGELAGYRLVHIASHARLLPTRGLAAHVKLWDGDLLLPEVAGLRLDGALVTLSACEGAAADTLPGEEVLSLSWAFLAAGARGVLASLWPVYDAATIGLMSAFYAALRQHGDAALALAQAQRALIATHQAHGDPSTEPQCWGSFVLIGESQML